MVSRATNLAAAMLTGVFSLTSACLFTVMDAVDVAFTEAAVGAVFNVLSSVLWRSRDGEKNDNPLNSTHLLSFANRDRPDRRHD